MMDYSTAVAVRYEDVQKDECRRFVSSISTQSSFEDNVWVCDLCARTPAERHYELSLYFKKIPEKYTELSKYFTLLRLMEGLKITSLQNDLAALSAFFRFLIRNYPETDWRNCGAAVAAGFKQALDNTGLSNQTLSRRWHTVNHFFRRMNGWENLPCRNPFSENPYPRIYRFDAKYIPENIVGKLDVAFRDSDVFLHIRCIYWILRLIPSRINEVLAMPLDCLKPYDGHYCLFIPTWKQNGGHHEPEMRMIHLEDTGVAGELIELIREQQRDASKIQHCLKESHKNTLFVCQTVHLKNGKRENHNSFSAIHDSHVTRNFRRVCKDNDILGNDGTPYKIFTHQFRHNGITDRLAAGFTPEQIRFMTAHHGDAMIYQSYNHLNLLPEIIRQKQSYVLKEQINETDSSVLFGGRILNMESQLEMRLLKNLRAHRVMGGICSDITGCKGDMTQCLDCEYFVPDAGQLSFFEEQAESWHRKAEKFNQYPLIRDTAIHNAELFQSIVKKIRRTEESCNG